MTKIICISDTHGRHRKMNIPEGDILIHAGDLSPKGRVKEIKDFNNWLKRLPHPHKIVIAGNHDFLFEEQPEEAQALLTHATYLEDSGTEIEGIKIWGSPITPWFFDWAFNRKRGEDIKQSWEKIPEDTDILITHGPPWGILDRTIHGQQVGCEELLTAVKRIKPRLHIFGHIHEEHGIVHDAHTQYINASMVDVHYQATQEAIVIEW